MDIREINQALSVGETEAPGIFPRLEELRRERFVFRTQFGLDAIPERPGLLLIRGARQIGKSTWLQQQIKHTIETFGPGSAYILNGDHVRNEQTLIEQIRSLVPLFNAKAAVRRLFIDEITAVANWERALKVLIDAGELRRMLIITTGSKAADLRHGGERLPGRKGRLKRTAFIFTPISFPEFKRVCGKKMSAKRLLPSYLLSGGAPVSCAALAAQGRIPEYIVEMTRDWIYGEFAASGRSRSALLAVMDCIHRFAGSPVGQSKLARETGLSNNTVAAGYIDQLADLLCVASAYSWDSSRRRRNRRKPCKFHMVNLQAAIAWHPKALRTPSEVLALDPQCQSGLLEWLVAQELWRRSAVQGDELSEEMAFWRSPSREIDFLVNEQLFLEVKRGKTSPIEFQWFPKIFPKSRLIVVSESKFETDCIVGMTIEDFLSTDPIG